MKPIQTKTTGPKGRLIDKFYKHKEKINLQYLSIINYLLGQEWIFPSYTGMNMSKEGIFCAALNNDYPTIPVLNLMFFAECTNQLNKIFGVKLDDEEFTWLESRINQLPTKFELE